MENVVLLKPAVKVTEFSNKRQLEQLIRLYVHIFLIHQWIWFFDLCGGPAL